jgi:hypothetical protein
MEAARFSGFVSGGRRISPRHMRPTACLAVEIPARLHDIRLKAAGPRRRQIHAGGPPLMEQLSQLLDQIPWSLLVIACLTLGLAPFVPEPHIWEKLKMLAAGTLVRPLDIFDFLLHATPFILAALKLAMMLLAPAK